MSRAQVRIPRYGRPAPVPLSHKSTADPASAAANPLGSNAEGSDFEGSSPIRMIPVLIRESSERASRTMSRRFLLGCQVAAGASGEVPTGVRRFRLALARSGTRARVQGATGLDKPQPRGRCHLRWKPGAGDVPSSCGPPLDAGMRGGQCGLRELEWPRPRRTPPGRLGRQDHEQLRSFAPNRQRDDSRLLFNPLVERVE